MFEEFRVTARGETLSFTFKRLPKRQLLDE